MVTITNLHEFENLCKHAFVERYYKSGYQGMLSEGTELTSRDLEVWDAYNMGWGYTCRIATTIPEDRIYANYTWIKETQELCEGFYMQLSRVTYGEEDL